MDFIVVVVGVIYISTLALIFWQSSNYQKEIKKIMDRLLDFQEELTNRVSSHLVPEVPVTDNSMSQPLVMPDETWGVPDNSVFLPFEEIQTGPDIFSEQLDKGIPEGYRMVKEWEQEEG